MSIEQQRLQPVGVWLDLSTDKPAVRPNETFTLSALFFYRMEGGMPTPIPNAKINFYRDYILRGFLYTDANGRAELLVLAEPTPGTYVYWVECDEVTPPVTSDKLTIAVTSEPMPTTLTLEANYTTAFKGAVVTFTGRLSTIHNGVPQAVIRLYANGIDMKIETETDGQGRFYLPWLARDSGDYNFTVQFAGDDLLEPSVSNTVAVTVSKTLLTDIASFCSEYGIPLEDVPTRANDIIVMIFESPPTGDWSAIESAVNSKVKEQYPTVDILGMKQYNSKVATFVYAPEESLAGRPVALAITLALTLIILAAIAVIGAFVIIVLPGIIQWATLRLYAKIKAENTERIKLILDDPTLTDDQKMDLISTILEEEAKERLVFNIVAVLKMLAVVGTLGIAGYLITQVIK